MWLHFDAVYHSFLNGNMLSLFFMHPGIFLDTGTWHPHSQSYKSADWLSCQRAQHQT